MTYKQAITNQKTWAQPAQAGFTAAGLIARLLTMVKIEIPVGYQDESGFHYGTKSVAKRGK